MSHNEETDMLGTLHKSMRCINILLIAAAGILINSSDLLASQVVNPLLGRTHLLPSPFTLPAGRLVYGTDVAIGITDFWQVGTNVLRDAFQFFNANTKLSMIDRPSVAAALTFGFETYNYRNIDSSNPDLRVTSYMPGIVFSFEILKPVALMFGGQYNYTEADLVTSDIATSGFIRGSVIEADLAIAYNMIGSDDGDKSPQGGKPAPKKTSRKGIGNTITPGISYDATYRLLGFGISHTWPGFQLGVHYYPTATKYSVVPIVVGGGSIDF